MRHTDIHTYRHTPDNGFLHLVRDLVDRFSSGFRQLIDILEADIRTENIFPKRLKFLGKNAKE